MSEEIAFPCPKCGQEAELVHVGRTHFGTCNPCKVGWFIGYKIFTVDDEIAGKAQENLQYLVTNFTCVS